MKPGGPECCGCEGTIEPGQRYRELIATNSDVFDKPFVRLTIHRFCIPLDEAELWEPTVERTRRIRKREQLVDEEIALFNAAAPVGTLVRYWTGLRIGPGKEARTRTPAQRMCDHGSVWVEGVASCIALSHVQVIHV